MGLRIKADKLVAKCKKYRYPIFILLIGLILMSIPGKTSLTISEKQMASETQDQETLEDRLSAILSKMHGAGNVEVILTPSSGEEVIYQTNQDQTSGSNSVHTKNDTVTITGTDRIQTGLIRQINPEQYQGAIVLCQGADDPNIRLQIVDAISKATGLGANKISVLKMQS